MSYGFNKRKGERKKMTRRKNKKNNPKPKAKLKLRQMVLNMHYQVKALTEGLNILDTILVGKGIYNKKDIDYVTANGKYKEAWYVRAWKAIKKFFTPSRKGTKSIQKNGQLAKEKEEVSAPTKGKV